jgi:signal transduction histidine kinase
MQLHDGTLRGIERQGRVGAIRALAETGDGTVWVGTAEGLLLRVEGGSLVNEPAIRERITLSIRSLHATQDGSLWIGYAGDGLGRLKRGRHARLTTADGLLDDFVSQLQSDASGFLWVLGNRGLSRVGLAEVEAVMDGQKERVRSRIYGRTDGLPALQPARDHSPASWRARDGRLWFSTRNGLLVVHPDKIQENLEPPPVRVERVTVDDQLRALHGARSLLYPVKDGGLVELGGPSQSLTLGPEHSKLGIEFAGLSFSSPENVQFRYRLSGFDPRWIEAGSDRRVTYPRLSAGDYEFHVQACNNAGVWNETGATLALSVQPFLWETWWFRTGAGLSIVVAAGGSVFLVARRRYRRKLLRLEARRAIEQERARIAKDIHDDLGASLTRITLLSQPTRGESEEGSGAAENLEQIHATARELTQAMGEVVWAVNPEHDSFDGLVNYLSNYAQSFLGVAGLRCRLEMPMRLPSQVLSAELRHNLFLAFKEALNNVVRHAAATEVRVSLTPDESGFTLQVEDNGRGFPRSAPPVDGTANPPVRANRGNGLANMHTRLREIGGSCELEGSEGAGVKIRFRVPWRKHL